MEYTFTLYALFFVAITVETIRSVFLNFSNKVKQIRTFQCTLFIFYIAMTVSFLCWTGSAIGKGDVVINTSRILSMVDFVFISIITLWIIISLSSERPSVSWVWSVKTEMDKLESKDKSCSLVKCSFHFLIFIVLTGLSIAGFCLSDDWFLKKMLLIVLFLFSLILIVYFCKIFEMNKKNIKYNYLKEIIFNSNGSENNKKEISEEAIRLFKHLFQGKCKYFYKEENKKQGINEKILNEIEKYGGKIIKKPL